MEPYQIDNLIEILNSVLVIVAGAGGLSFLVHTALKGRRRISAEHVGQLMEKIDQLHGTIEEVRVEQLELREDIRDRVGEISDRLDFAERMLTKGSSQVGKN